MLVPRQEGYRAWRVKTGQAPQEIGETRGGVQWIALPARALVTVPMRIQVADPSRREAAAQLELEAAGLGQETADVHNFELLSTGTDEKDGRATAIVQVAPLPADVLEGGVDAHYAPSVAFRKLTPGQMLVWEEAGAYVVAVPGPSGAPLHFQALASRLLDGDAAAELRCILASLELAGLSPEVDSICVMVAPKEGVDLEDLVPASFAQGLDLPVSVRPEEAPALPTQPARLVPAPVMKERHDRQQRRVVLLGALGFALVLLGALGAFAARVALNERATRAELARLDELEPELMRIRDARASWEDMKWAISPRLYPVETFHQVAGLLPDNGIRLTKVEIRNDSLVVDGEASTLGDGIRFRDVLTSAAFFKEDWQWEALAPVSLPSGLATFHAEARPFALLEENQEATRL